MPNEYQGAGFATILPQVDWAGQLQKIKDRQRQEQLRQQLAEQKIAEEHAQQQGALARYADQKTDNLMGQIDPKNPYNALLTAGLYDLKKQVQQSIEQGANDSQVTQIINQGAGTIMNKNASWNAMNAAIEQNSQAVKTMGLDPKEVAAIARKKAFYAEDPKNPGKLILDEEKIANMDPSYDPVQDVYKNFADELSPVQLFDNRRFTKRPATATDVNDPKTGDLLNTTTDLNLIEGLHRPVMKDGKLTVEKIGAVPMVDTDEKGNETPMFHDIEVVDGKTGKTITKKEPLMGLSEEVYQRYLDEEPGAEVWLNQQVSKENKRLKAAGLPILDKEHATAFKRVALYNKIPETVQPVLSVKNLSARQDMQTAAAKERSQYSNQLRQQNKTTKDGGTGDKEHEIRYRAATSKATTDVQKANQELTGLKRKLVKNAATKAKISELQKVVDAGIRPLIEQYMNGSSLTDQPANPAPSTNKWNQFKRK